tara:strand:- start:165 stop:527 length:363 start_codon:yes stop_codon:yes gene_type:complete
MKDCSPENISNTLVNVEQMIAHQLKTIETLERLKTSLRIALVWPEAWQSSKDVKVHDYFKYHSIHPIGKSRPATEELRVKLYQRLRHRNDAFGQLVGGEKRRQLTALELAFIRGHLDTFT